jgi:hypothetical protein
LGKGQEAFMMKVGGVAQVAECLLFKGWNPEFKSHSHKRKKKESEKTIKNWWKIPMKPLFATNIY